MKTLCDPAAMTDLKYSVPNKSLDALTAQSASFNTFLFETKS